MSLPPKRCTIERDGWTLVSAEEQHAKHPDTFHIPPRHARESLRAGDGVRLLFDIETKEGGLIVDRGVDRMWVIVKRRVSDGYTGVLDNDPGEAENLDLRRGVLISFGPEHIANIDSPPREYVVETYGEAFFED